MGDRVSLLFTCPGCGKDLILTNIDVVDNQHLAVLGFCSHCVKITTTLCHLEYLVGLSLALTAKKAAEEARKKIDKITDPEGFDLENCRPKGPIQ